MQHEIKFACCAASKGLKNMENHPRFAAQQPLRLAEPARGGLREVQALCELLELLSRPLGALKRLI